MRVPGEALEEPLEVLVQHRVPADRVGEGTELVLGRQLAVHEQVTDLDERRVLGQLLDRVATVTQDAGVPVDEADLRRAGRGVHQAGVERDQPGLGQQLAQADPVRAAGRAGDLHAVLAARVGEGRGALGTVGVTRSNQ